MIYPDEYETVTLSLNNRLIVEVYKKEALRSKEKNGFAYVDQKLFLKGLRVLIDAKFDDGTVIHKGSIAYIKEEVLHTQQWAQKAFESTYFQEPFLIVDKTYVEFIEPPQHNKCQMHIVDSSGTCKNCGGTYA